MKTYDVSESFLRSVPVPAETSTYKPVPHGDLITFIESSIRQRGLDIVSKKFRCSNEGLIASGKFKVSMKEEDLSFMIAFENSYNKQVALRVALGAEVMICSNGMLIGDMGNFLRRHTKSVNNDYKSKIELALDNSYLAFNSAKSFKNESKKITLDEKTKAELIGRLYVEQEILTSTQISIVKKEIKSPSINYSSPNTLWEFYNYCTFALKKSHPTDWMESHLKIHEFFTNEFSIKNDVLVV